MRVVGWGVFIEAMFSAVQNGVVDVVVGGRGDDGDRVIGISDVEWLESGIAGGHDIVVKEVIDGGVNARRVFLFILLVGVAGMVDVVW